MSGLELAESPRCVFYLVSSVVAFAPLTGVALSVRSRLQRRNAHRTACVSMVANRDVNGHVELQLDR